MAERATLYVCKGRRSCVDLLERVYLILWWFILVGKYGMRDKQLHVLWWTIPGSVWNEVAYIVTPVV